MFLAHKEFRRLRLHVLKITAVIFAKVLVTEYPILLQVGLFCIYFWFRDFGQICFYDFHVSFYNDFSIIINPEAF